MKILHISYSDSVGGASRAAYRIHQALLKSGVNSQMLVLVKMTTDDTVIAAQDFTNYFHNKFINIVERSTNKVLNRRGSEPLSLGIIGRRLYKFINRSDADIVHLHWINGSTLSLRDISKIKKPLVWTLHDLWPVSGITHYDADKSQVLSLKYNFITRLVDNNLKKCKLALIASKKIQCIANSKWTATQISAKVGDDVSNIPILSYPIDLKFWTRKHSKVSARKILGIASDKKVIMFGAPGGDRDRRKGFDLLIQALLLLPKEIVKTSSLVVFGGDFDDTLISFGNIVCLGAIQNDEFLRIVYSAADVVVMPSRLETFGQVALEAIACGSPVGAFNTSGLRDVISHKVTGYLAKPYESKSLANGISWCLKEYEHFGDQAWSANVNKFSYTEIAKKYVNFYSGFK